MAELPEIAKLTGQLDAALRGKRIAEVTVLQEKCTNVPVDEMAARTVGATVEAVRYRGKWIVHELSNGESVLLSLGMGADVLWFEPGDPEPEKYQVRLRLEDGSGYTVRFWWFGRYSVSPTATLDTDSEIQGVARDPFDAAFTREYFRELLAGRRTQVKSFLLGQKDVGGIGNAYAHDILFVARLHPQAKISDLTPAQVDGLFDAIQDVLGRSRDKGSFSYEKDLYGREGGFTPEDFLVGYSEDPCPACGGPIEQLRTGSTTSYLCPVCQPRLTVTDGRHGH